MRKSLITGLTALSLTFAVVSPVHANGLDREDLGKIVFGLAALVALGAIVEDGSSDDSVVQAHERTRRGYQSPQNWSDLNRPRPRAQHRHADLPRNCLRAVDTRFGTIRMFGQRCLQRNYARAASLPSRCAVRVYTADGPRRGYDPQCLREQGYRVSRRH